MRRKFSVVLGLCMILSGCALFNPPKNITLQEQRTIQLASAEEQFNNASRTALDLYNGGAINGDQYLQFVPIKNTFLTTLAAAKAANDSGNLDTTDGKLVALREILVQYIALRDSMKGGG